MKLVLFHLCTLTGYQCPVSVKSKVKPSFFFFFLDKGVSERAFMMISKKNPQFYDILKEGTQCILECLQEDLKNRK